MVIKQPAFGQRVRQLRRSRGLSQAHVAGPEMSPSYISLVESGRRMPSLELAKVIAERLEVPLPALTATGYSLNSRAHRVELIGRLIGGRSAIAQGDHLVAADQFRSVIAEATAPEDEDVAWEARWELSATLRQLDQHGERGEILRQLFDDPMTTGSALLSARVAAALAETARFHGSIRESIRMAEKAVAAAQVLEATAPERVRAQTELLVACVESGEWERSAAIGEELLEIVDDVPMRVLRVLVYWTAGCALFLSDRADADRLFSRALEFVSPVNDVHLWLRLCLAAAAQRVSAGAVKSAEPLLRQVRQATATMGTPADRVRLSAVEAAAALERGDVAAAAQAARAIDVDLPGQQVQQRARCLVVLGRVARASGKDADAVAHYQRAASCYEDSGAYRLAAGAWRESSMEPSSRVWSRPDPHALILP